MLDTVARFLACKVPFFTQQHYAIDSLVLEIGTSLFIAEPRSDFNRCHEQQISENHICIIYSILIVISKQKTDIQEF